MLDNSASMFRSVAMGTAIENLPLGSTELKVSPHEKLPFMDGELVDRIDTMDYDHQNMDGKESGGTAFVSGGLTATWLPQSNRKTPPNVRRGERIELFQFGSNDKYYWRCMNLDENLRRLETVVFGVNANPSESQDGTSPDNMYFIEMSAHGKSITLSTSQMNGEYCTYDLQFDLTAGLFIVKDSEENKVFIDTRKTNIRLENSSGTFVELNKENINGYAPSNISLKADNNVDVKAKKITLNGGGSVFTLESGGTTLKTPKFGGTS